MPTHLFGWLVAAVLFLFAAVSMLAAQRAWRSRKRIHNQLRSLEQEQNAILKGLELAARTAQKVLGPDPLPGTVEEIGRGFQRLFGAAGLDLNLSAGIGSSEATRFRIGDRIDEEPVGSHRDPSEDKTAGSILTFPILLRDERLGELRILESPLSPLSRGETEVARLLTELVAIGVRYRAQLRMIESTEDEKRRFVFATAHDLKTPISTIQQLIYVVLDGYAGELSPKGRELLGKIRGRADRLLELLSDLLNLATEEGDTAKRGDEDPVSLSGLFDAEVAYIKDDLQARGLELRSHRPEGPLTYNAASGDMEKIFGNLLSNAVKYTPRGGTIQVELIEAPTGFLFRVKDSGIGIPKDALPRLFTGFFRAPNARAMERHGSGLGLVLVQKLVQKYGGRIRVASREGEGARFEVLLPHG